MSRKRLLFVSPRFLFPADEGGKIRTGQVLRGMKGGAFEITLVAPAVRDAASRFAQELSSVCDRFVSWPLRERSKGHKVLRMRHLFARWPIPIVTDCDANAQRIIERELATQPDVVVFDFAHAAIFRPRGLNAPSVMFTHNVESEIFARHADVASNPLARWIWANQHRKMERFEREELARFEAVVAVSQRDADRFREAFALERVAVIPTGVDLEFYRHELPGEANQVVFTGAMDWAANVDGIEFLLDEVWEHVLQHVPDARMKVVGRNPPAHLRDKAKRFEGFTFTGFVDDIRDHVPGAAAYVIPLRVGGGTRIKGYEALAMGAPLVSTTVGVEGLSLEPGEHYLQADTAQALADALVRVLQDRELGRRLSVTARRFVEENFSFERAARVFEEVCLGAIAQPDHPRP